jgi:hypothetical protein
MSTPNYFNNFPNIDYANALNKAGIQTKIPIKDYFHMLRVKDNVFTKVSNYYTYNIQYGERPEQVALKEYGDSKHYWLILNINNITDTYSQWPLTPYELDVFITKKYKTTENANEIHHYETQEVINDDGDVLLEAGLVVDPDFVFEYQKNPSDFNYFTSFPGSVTNLEYEYAENERKTEIQLLNKKYVYAASTELKRFGKEITKEGIKSELDIADFYK